MSTQQPYRRLTRSSNRMIAGVCAGVAEYLRVDPTLIRILAVVIGFFTFPVVPILYVICWLVIPDERG